MPSDEWKRELRHLIHPFFIVNFFLISTFFLTKLIPQVCVLMYDNCLVDVREYELLTFLGCVVAFKKKRLISFTNFLATFCMFAKIVNVLMFGRYSYFYALGYLLLWLIQAVFLHQPVYRGPDKVVYFRENTLVEEVIQGDRRVTWLIAFYAAWSPACVNFAPHFAELSEDYGLDNLRFGKVDVTRCPAMAAKFKVDTSSWTKELPTVILFQAGKEVDRRPGTLRAKVQRFDFSYKNIVKSFGLNEIYGECKKNPIGGKKKAKAAAAAAAAAADGKSKAE